MKHYVFQATQHKWHRAEGYVTMQVIVWQVKKNKLIKLGTRFYTFEDSKQAALNFLEENSKKCEIPRKIMLDRHPMGGRSYELIDKYATLQEI